MGCTSYNSTSRDYSTFLLLTALSSQNFNLRTIHKKIDETTRVILNSCMYNNYCNFLTILPTLVRPHVRNVTYLTQNKIFRPYLCFLDHINGSLLSFLIVLYISNVDLLISEQIKSFLACVNTVNPIILVFLQTAGLYIEKAPR